MCELLGMSSRHPATLTVSLDELSRHGGITGPHTDGWGIAYYDARDVRLLKEPCPAAESPFMHFIEQQALRSRTVIAHIRKATVGAATLENTQPFCRELGGRMHVFAHNGALEGVFTDDTLCVGRIRPVGDTDSEWAFCALLAKLEALWLGRDSLPALDERLAVVARFACDSRKLGAANFLYCDGHTLFVHAHKRRFSENGAIRPPGLCSLSRTCEIASQVVAAAGLRVESHDREQQVLLVASVPLTDEQWRPMEEGELMAVENGRCVRRVLP